MIRATREVLSGTPGEVSAQLEKLSLNLAQHEYAAGTRLRMLAVTLAQRPNGLALGDHPGFEQVELDVAFHVGDGGLAGLAGGEVAGFLGFAGAVALGAVTDGEAGQEDLQQERGECEILLARGGKPRRCPSRPAGRAGS
jgi:hypothetical protein